MNYLTMKFAYAEKEKFVSDYKPLLEILQINNDNPHQRIAIRVLIGDKEDWLSIQQLDNWLSDYGYKEQQG
jgi:hypothetical protein